MSDYRKEKFYWFKLKEGFFKRHDIRIIKAMPNGKDYVIFYLQLLCESLSHDGNLRFSEEIPYNEEMLAIITETNIDIVRSAMKVLVQLNMIEIMDDQTIYLTKLQNMVGSTTVGAEKKMLQREKNTQLLGGGQKVDKCPLEIEKEIDIEKDKEKDINNKIKEDDEIKNIPCVCAREEKSSSSTLDNLETNLNNFLEEFGIMLDSYTAIIAEIDFELLTERFRESEWLKANISSFKKVCEYYPKIISGYYKDYNKKPKEDNSWETLKAMFEEAKAKEEKEEQGGTT